MTTESSTGGHGLTAAQLDCFASLADEMIPAGPDMPSGTAAHVQTSGLDAVLRSRPDLAEPLRLALDQLATEWAESGEGSALELIRSAGHEDAWAMLSTVVASAYFLNPAVCEALGYPGQEAIPVDEQDDDIDPRQLARVRERGPVYRPTPPDRPSR